MRRRIFLGNKIEYESPAEIQILRAFLRISRRGTKCYLVFIFELNKKKPCLKYLSSYAPPLLLSMMISFRVQDEKSAAERGRKLQKALKNCLLQTYWNAGCK